MNALERFLNYVTFDTTSDEGVDCCPSTAKQLVLADRLADELTAMGAENVRRDENGYVYAVIPSTAGCEKLPAIGLISHMDTSPDVSGENVKPKIIEFDGKNAKMIPDRYIGEQMVVSDGTTLLGADDKAGVAEIMAACERIITEKIPHGKICVGFTPDEEIGRGADLFDVDNFGADFAYTVDGGEISEFEYENFNAADVKITVNGVNTHPGSAKNIMKNAILYLNEFMNMLPAAETPAHTEGREGFFHLTDIEGTTSSASAHMLIRDFSDEDFKKRKDYIRRCAEFLNEKYGEGTVAAEITDSYYNMRSVIEKNMHTVQRAINAMKKAGISEPEALPIRGGTDGARLCFMGLVCPNLPTGGINFHSLFEAIPVKALETMTDVIINIVSAE